MSESIVWGAATACMAIGWALTAAALGKAHRDLRHVRDSKERWESQCACWRIRALNATDYAEALEAELATLQAAQPTLSPTAPEAANG
jgi:hypothetical protein